MTRESLVNRGGLLAVLIVTCLSVAAFAAPSEDVIYSFGGPAQVPIGSSLASDSAGNLYGTGIPLFGDGEVYEVVRPVPPNTQWTSNVLYVFPLSSGSIPIGGVILDSSGNLYGTAEGGTYGAGVVFELTAPATAGGQWTETVLYNFKGGSTDGLGPTPWGSLTFDSSGNLYGVTSEGGINCHHQGCGVVFELTPPVSAGGEWTETVIHFFGGGDGSYPVGAPIFDGKGNLYGAADSGGKYGYGLVYRLAAPATAGEAWNYKVLYSFAGGATDSEFPLGSLALRGDGNLYGVGEGGQYGFGTVFEVTPPAVPGGEWTDTILHSFGATPTDGILPEYNLIFDGAGNLYGITVFGGSDVGCAIGHGCGTAYELSPPATEGAPWTETILHIFPAYKRDARGPCSGLLPSKEGALFGTAGGPGNGGSIYRLIP